MLLSQWYCFFSKLGKSVNNKEYLRLSCDLQKHEGAQCAHMNESLRVGSELRRAPRWRALEKRNLLRSSFQWNINKIYLLGYRNGPKRGPFSLYYCPAPHPDSLDDTRDASAPLALCNLVMAA